MWCHSRNRLPSRLATKGGAFCSFFERCCAALVEKWHWMLLGGITCAILGSCCGYWNNEFQSNQAKRTRDALNAEAAVLDNALDLANEKLASFRRALGVTDFEKEASR